MTDWKQAAAAFAPDMPADAVERAAQPLEKLEAVFRPLVARLPLETETASVLLLAPEEKP